jgi:hypothetical protein
MFKARSYRILTVLSFSLISACGMLHEKETKPSTITQSLSSSDDCEMPEIKTLMGQSGHVNIPEAQAWVSCFRKTVDKSFSEVKGSETDAVSAKELYRLASHGLISLPIKTADQFDGVGGFMSLLNPEGHPSVTKPQALAVADLLKEGLDIFADAQDNARNLNRHKLSAFLKHALILFPGKGEFTQTHVKELLTLLKDDTLRAKISSAFPVVRLLFRDGLTAEGETRLAGSSLRELIQTGVDGYSILDAIPNDEFNTDVPKFADEHSAEVLKIVESIKTYFSQPKFGSLKAREFRAMMIDGLGTTAGLTEDALLLARRFLAEPDEDQAVSVRLLYPFLDDAKSLVGDFKSISKAFPDRQASRTRAELLAMNDPTLTSVALKSYFYLPYAYGSYGTPAAPMPVAVKRKAIPINMDPAIETVVERYLFKKLFVAFGTPGQIDPEKGIYIPKKALSAAEERDAKNLARLFLRFATSLSHKEDAKKQNTTSDITIDDQFTVKAESVYRIMGLVGDRWFLDGNNDGYLNSEEFFSVISMFMEANRFTSFPASYYKTNDDDYWKDPVFPRTDFIHQLLEVSSNNDELGHSPYASLRDGIVHMKDPASLIHSLMSRSDDPINAFHNVGYDFQTLSTRFESAKLTDWVEGSGLVPANAILGLLDRAFLKCDLDDDSKLNWDELDCASDLLSGGLYHVAESGAINLDPGVHDGVILLANAVYDPAIDATTGEFEKRLKQLPRQIFKLFLAQGSASVTLDQAILDSLSFSTDDLIPTVVLNARPELRAIYLAEVKNVFGDCDANHDDTYSGAEVECVFDRAQKKWLEFLHTPEMRAELQSILPFLTPEQIEGVISSVDFKAWFVYLVKGKLPVTNVATESSILDAFEGAIRRECPLGIPPREGGGCLQP